KEGIVDFFKTIKDLELSDLDLTPLNHDNTRQAIIDSWTNNLPYKYLIQWNDGKMNADINNKANFDNKYMTPSASVKWLFDLIFNTIGWTYSGLKDIHKDWMTYPNGYQNQDISFQVGNYSIDNIIPVKS